MGKVAATGVRAGASAVEGMFSDASAHVARERFEAVLASEPAAQELVAGALAQSDAPLKVCNDVRLAVEELFVNVASYAYGARRGTVDVEVAVDAARGVVAVRLTDKGAPFDPFAREARPPASSIEDASIGGLGIVLVKSLMDECLYRREGDRNVVIVARRWRPGGDSPSAAAEEDAGAGNPPEKIGGPLDDGDLAAVMGGIMDPVLEEGPLREAAR